MVTHPPITEFVYVDTAFGGVDRRNNIRKIASVVVNGLTDCYVSHNRATDALVTWVKEHRNKKGNPTVEGFDGETWADNVHLDFDAADDPARAPGWLLKVLVWLEAVGVDLRAVRTYFSGAKGFHLEIPHTLFGGFAPAKDLPRRLRRAAKLILGEIPFDSSVYDTLRLRRLENSRNSKSGLFKIRLTVGEARTLSLDEIRAMASAARDTSVVPELAPVPDEEWLPNDELAAIWEETLDQKEEPESSEQRAPTDEARDRQTVAAIAASWPHGGTNTVEGEDGKGQVSRHADYLLAIGGFLARRTDADHVAAILEASAEQAGDQTFLLDRDWRNEIRRISDGAADRIRRGERVKGLPSVAKHFPQLAIVLAAVWPAPTIHFDWEDDDVGRQPSETGTGDGSGSAPTYTASSVRGEAPWPEPIAEEAYHGWLGDAVRRIAPHTEADTAALFAHLIGGCGAVLGLGTRALAGNAPHPPKFNAVVVGKTAQGRTGTAQRAAEGIVVLADPTIARRMLEGLSSGEGLVWQVRDPIRKFERPKGGGGPEEVVIDPGEDDKRLLVIESEFASVLRVAQREGNTLTAIIRRAWDRDDLRTLTKNNPATATGAHINIIGHVSRDELLRYLDRSELANGFANRHLFFSRTASLT